MHLIRTVGQAQRSCDRVRPCEKEVIRYAGSTVRLDGTIHYTFGHQRRNCLDHGDFVACLSSTNRIDHVCRTQDQQASLIDVCTRVGNIGDNGALASQTPTEGLAREHTLAHRFQASLCHADEPHTVVYPTRSQACLCDLEATPLTQDHVLDRDTNILEQHLTVAMWCIVIAEDVERANDANTGRIHWNQDHALLFVLIGIGIGLAHYDADFAAWIASARGPPLSSVHNVMVSFPNNGGANVPCVRTRDLRLGHREA
mmetsp:Transcript_7264/g.22291  ORF Transcript_7264/g.22291 Transcript_7264/m.22291 type:complete len:257 (-) Transcript_7264:1646-2416(-)